MAFIYSATGKKIPLRLSTDDMAIRFARPQAASSAVRFLSKRGPIRETTPVSFGRTLLMPATGMTNAPIRAVARALPRAHVASAERSAPVYVDDDSKLRAIATEEITVRFKRKPSSRTLNLLLHHRALRILRRNEFHPRQFIVVPTERPDEWKTLDVANALSESPEVEYAAPNFVAEHRKFMTPDDPLLAQQWHLNNDGSKGASLREDVDAFRAWDLTLGGSSKVVIAIIDDGVDIKHPDLKANIWRNPSSTPRDRNGRNFYDADHPYDPSPRYFHPPYDQMDGNDIHGTCCAGVAAAVGNNGKGVTGIAFRCRILPVKIFGGDTLATDENVANAIRYAAKHAAVISCSWGGVQNPDLESAVNDVARDGRQGKGCIVLCATGNEYDSKISFPARYPGALGVGASNDRGKRSKYSNYGPAIEFVAPSSDEDRNRQSITTTDVSKKNRGFKLKSSYTDDFGGTSSATPLAAGIAGLVLSVDPDLTRDEVRNILRSTAAKIDSPAGNYKSGYSLQYGYGRLNAYEAVVKAQAGKAKAKSKRGRSKSKSRMGRR